MLCVCIIMYVEKGEKDIRVCQFCYVCGDVIIVEVVSMKIVRVGAEFT